MKTIYFLCCCFLLIGCTSSPSKGDPKELDLEIKIVNASVAASINMPMYVGEPLPTRPKNPDNHFVLLEVEYKNIGQTPIGIPNNLLYVMLEGKPYVFTHKRYGMARTDWRGLSSRPKIDALGKNRRFFIFEIPNTLKDEIYFVPAYPRWSIKKDLNPQDYHSIKVEL